MEKQSDAKSGISTSLHYCVCRTFATLQLKDDAVSVSAQLLSQNAFGYVLPITSFVVAWLETWFLDFKVLTQEADEERGECSDPEELEYDICHFHHLTQFLSFHHQPTWRR